jgi:tetratricopeptide (TPR) repeat protein
MAACIGSIFLLLLFVSGCGRAANTPGDLEARMDEAVTLLSLYDFSAAQRILPDLARQTPPSHPRWEEVTYAAAIALWHKAPGTRENIEAAAALLQQLLQSDPAPDRKAQYLLDLGRIAEVEDFAGDLRDPQEARQLYQQALETATAQGLKAEIRLRQIQLDLETLQPDGFEAAIAALRGMLDHGYEEPWNTLAWLLLGTVHDQYTLDKAAALDAFLQVDLEHYPVASRISGFVWGRAQLCLELGRTREAERQFQLILDTFPRTTYRYVAELELQRLQEDKP